MSRHDDEPVFIAEFRSRSDAERAWESLTEAGISSAVVSDLPPWGIAVHRIQVARKHAAAALEHLHS